MKSTKQIFLLFVLSIYILSCKKNISNIPPPSEELNSKEYFFDSTSIVKFIKAIPLPNDNILILGTSETNTGDTKTFLQRIDSLGRIIWRKKYNSSSNDICLDFGRLSNGDYLIAGSTTDKIPFFIRTDNNGNLIQRIDFNYSKYIYLTSFFPTADGGWIASGEIQLSGPIVADSILFLKYNSSNQIDWKKDYIISSRQIISSIVEDPGDGYFCSGYVILNDSCSGCDEYMKKILFHLNEFGDTIFRKIFMQDQHAMCSELLIHDNSLYLNGSFVSNSFGAKYMKTDLSGNEIFTYTYGESDSKPADFNFNSEDRLMVAYATHSSDYNEYYCNFRLLNAETGESLLYKSFQKNDKRYFGGSVLETENYYWVVGSRTAWNNYNYIGWVGRMEKHY